VSKVKTFTLYFILDILFPFSIAAAIVKIKICGNLLIEVKLNSERY